jgi:glycosyltransferase involved in cell wall biosynthesis
MPSVTHEPSVSHFAFGEPCGRDIRIWRSSSPRRNEATARKLFRAAASMTDPTPASGTPGLSVIVPAFNEERLLDASIRALRKTLDATGISSEIVLVDDGSTDRTPIVADSLATLVRDVRVYRQVNKGIGGAFRAGAVLASGTYLILWPVDMVATPDDFKPFIAQFGEADVIVGCRRKRLGYSTLMRLNSWIYRNLVALLFGLRVRDVNWIHAYRRELFLRIRLTQNGIPMLAEALVRLRDAGATFAEVEVDMRARTLGVPSASRPRVMWETLTGLLSFWETWRFEKLSQKKKEPRARR